MSGYPMRDIEIVAWFKKVRDALKKHHPSIDIAAFAILLNQPDGYANMMAFLDEHLPVEGGWAAVAPEDVERRVASLKNNQT